ncbi:PepSY-associated TM helix domain-containing protein [Burkholderia lata]|uniref:PepSY-associated TM helix domain-containing protein n=1 Tax=Burkholderia lata (strain ATCC 17760 / DSM 23089 / LMG 22485 / NCIMB 9086 / R18194 / 383) TaxID=482957 RepID=A0A6P2NF90_BURL3|nr:PepSY-associated TM helix domain-containing protein [Burkholderia lata]VWB93565.1 PepSY-associated TM helix domain-containing protein [Burkholderia lata]
MSVADPIEIDAAPASRTAPGARPAGAGGARSRRGTFIKWLRKVHGWVGLWGAALGLLFGTTGFLLNHRAPPLRIQTGAPKVETLRLDVPDPEPASPQELAKWLRGQPDLHLPERMGRVQKEPEHPVAWGDRETVQPEHWQLVFASPRENVAVDYWVGSDTITLKRTGNGTLAWLTNLHKGVGMSIGWVLLVDTLAGALILLSLTGVLLWTELNRRKTVGVVLVIGSIVAIVWAAGA